MLLEARGRRQRRQFEWEYQQLSILARGLGLILKPLRSSTPERPMSAEQINAQLTAAAANGLKVQYRKPD